MGETGSQTAKPRSLGSGFGVWSGRFAISWVAWMIVALRYGAGLRLQECLELRVKDIDLERQIIIRRGKGQKDRPTVLPTAVIEPLSRHLDLVKRQHLNDPR